MKKSMKFLTMMFALAFVAGTISCDSGEDDITDIIKGGGSGGNLSDGVYIVGTAVGTDTTDAHLLTEALVGAPDFGTQERPGLFEGYIFMTNGLFSFVEVDGDDVTVLGGSFTEEVNADNDKLNYKLGTLSENGTATMSGLPSDGGLVQVQFDKSTSQYVVLPVDYWEVIGNATEGGWSAGQEIALVSATKDEVKYMGQKIVLRGPDTEFKIRYNSNWNLDIDAEDCDEALEPCLNFNTNFGGEVDALAPGGSNIKFAGGDGVDGEYTIIVTYTPGEGNSISMSLERTGDVEPLPEYPEAMYMVGGSIGGWDWAANGVQLNAVADNPHVFWAIVWIDGPTNNEGFKFAPVADWVGDFGKSGDATDGVYAKGSDNVPPPAAAGYYTVVVNLDKETIEVNAPKVYGIGDAFGSWDAATHAFTVDNANEVITSPVTSGAGDLRIHVASNTLTKAESTDAVEWWQAEFVVLDGKIEYRGKGGDQARNAVTAGQTIKLNFKTGVGTIE
ncbi:MAG: SusF/SusE family outer membrane protein [Cyclobacteriaceae bacterium]